MNISRRNAEGYHDPTAYEALKSVSKSEKKKPKPVRVYIASPYKGDTETNVQNALRYCRFAVEQGAFPIAPHCYLPRFLDDDIPAERELALSFGLRLLRGCREVWVFGGTISEGMRAEIEAAKQQRKTIKYFSDKKGVIQND